MNPVYHAVATREPAENGRANVAAPALLARRLGVVGKPLSLVRGTDKPSNLFLLRAVPERSAL